VKNIIQITARFGTLDLQVEATFSGGITLISGENGAGKTTLLRCLAGLQQAQGQIIVHGQIWLDSHAGFELPPQERRIGCVWADAALLPWLSVEKNIMLGANLPNSSGKLTFLAEKLEITSLMQRKPQMLSTGEAQRVALARAIYRKPAMLLLDEPFSAQAPAVRQRLRMKLKRIQTELNIPVIMVSHDTEDAKILAGQHWHMRQGNLLVEVARHETNEELQA